jgi:hypothetical protein
VPQEVALAPGESVSVPVLAPGRFTASASLLTGGALLAPSRKTLSYALFTVPLTGAQAPGQYRQRLELQAGAQRLAAVLQYRVRPVTMEKAGEGVLLVNPEPLSPPGWSYHKTPPQLCWRVAGGDGQPPLRYRLIAVGPTPVDSGWIAGTCWQTSALERGTYLWKVFVRDARGYMNRTNQRPFAFVMR